MWRQMTTLTSKIKENTNITIAIYLLYFCNTSWIWNQSTKLRIYELCLKFRSVLVNHHLQFKIYVFDCTVCELTLHDHISGIGSCVFRLHRLHQPYGLWSRLPLYEPCGVIYHCISLVESSATLPPRQFKTVQWLQCLYYEVFLTRLPSTTSDLLWRVFTDGAHLVTGPGPKNHMTKQMKELHWLPIGSY